MTARPRRGRWRRIQLLLLCVAAVAVAAGCGEDEGTATTVVAPLDEGVLDPEPTAPAEADEESAVVEVRIEELDAIPVEGFEVGLRFEQGDGQVVESALWSDVVAAQDPSTVEGPTDTVLEQPVPAGEVVVLAEVTVGTGPPPSTPDVDGELPCRLELALDAGERAVVEVRFAPADDCLHHVDS
jgi:hypothetical protein